jgi:hypothetical protein
MVPDTEARSSLSAFHAVSSDGDASAERWRQWQLRNAVASRTAARRARIAFTVIFAGLGTWLGLHLLDPSLWPWIAARAEIRSPIRRLDAIEEPMRWIAANAGHEGSIVVQRVKEMTGDEGFNAQSEHSEDLVNAGVIDPVKVVRSALQHAASIASLLLTTEAVMSQLAESRKKVRCRERAGPDSSSVIQSVILRCRLCE